MIASRINIVLTQLVLVIRLSRTFCYVSLQQDVTHDFQTQECCASFFVLCLLRRMLKLKRNLFKSKDCDKSFTDKSSLKRHLLTHTVRKSLELEFSKLFAYLSGHVRTCTGRKSFDCKECGKQFSHLSVQCCLILTHPGGKYFKCDEFVKSISYLSASQYLIHAYLGKENLKYKECGKLFSHLSIVENHTHMYSREKLFDSEQYHITLSYVNFIEPCMCKNTWRTISNVNFKACLFRSLKCENDLLHS